MGSRSTHWHGMSSDLPHSNQAVLNPDRPKSRPSILYISTLCMWTKQYAVSPVKPCIRGVPFKGHRTIELHRDEVGAARPVEGLPSHRMCKPGHPTGCVSQVLPFFASKCKSLHFHPVYVSLLLSHINYTGTVRALADIEEQVPLWFAVESLGLGKVSVSAHPHLFLLSYGVSLERSPNLDLTPSWELGKEE